MIRRYFGIFFLLFIFTYSLFFMSYKRHDYQRFGQGDAYYCELVKSPFDSSLYSLDNFRYRVLTPLIVKSIHWLPFYNTTIQSDFPDQRDQSIFFHFLFVNYLFMLFTACCYFFLLERYYGIPPTICYLMSFFILLSFHSMRSSYIMLTDAGTHFFIACLFILYKQNQWLAFLLSSVLAIFQKETVIIIMLIIFFIEFLFQEKHSLKRHTIINYCFLCVPSLIFLFIFKQIYPTDQFFHTHSITGYLNNFLSFFNYRTYTLNFIANSFISFLPLIAAMIAHLWLRINKHTVMYNAKRLIIWPIIFLLALTIGVDSSNEGRIAFFGLPIYIPYLAHILLSLSQSKILPSIDSHKKS